MPRGGVPGSPLTPIRWNARAACASSRDRLDGQARSVMMKMKVRSTYRLGRANGRAFLRSKGVGKLANSSELCSLGVRIGGSPVRGYVLRTRWTGVSRLSQKGICIPPSTRGAGRRVAGAPTHDGESLPGCGPAMTGETWKDAPREQRPGTTRSRRRCECARPGCSG